MILEKENYKIMTNTSTDIISGLEQYADSEGPRIDLNSLYDDGNNEIVLLGVGNILLTDEGLGVHVVKELKESFMIQSVQTSFIQSSSSIEHSLCKYDGEQP